MLTRVNVQAYAVLTDVPAVFVLYDSPFWSGAYLLLILSVSVWNGGGFYIEVFGRKYVCCSHGTLQFLTMHRFERELEALRKELAEAQSKSQRSSPTMGPSETDSEPVSPLIANKLLGGDEAEVSANVDVGLSLQLEGTKKDR
jgi:hypothetical protein